MEPHIRPIRVNAEVALPTSPEFAMKRLLVGGLPRIYQIASAFRNEPRSPQHSPEFTMLEFYRAFAGEEQCMREVERWLETLALRIYGSTQIPYQGRVLNVATPWPRLTVRELFLEHADVDLERTDLHKECLRLGLSPSSSDTWDDLYHRIWLERVERKLPFDRAVFVTRYPASQAALAERDGFWARRFELYLGGMELGNGFQELTDPAEQRARFAADMDLRERVYGTEFPKTPLDEEFLEALEEGMPPSSGIAIGMDRVVMLFANETEIDRTIAVPAHWWTETNLPH
jgi:lysyl-tRNA synthetase class 2